MRIEFGWNEVEEEAQTADVTGDHPQAGGLFAANVY